MHQAELLSQLRNLLSQGEAACLNGHRSGAEELLNIWLDLPMEEGCELERLGHQLWDLLDPPAPEPDPQEETWPTLADVPGIFSRARELLLEHWGEISPDGDEAVFIHANHLWGALDVVIGEFRYDDAFTKLQWLEAVTLFIALEQHIDPQGLMLHARFERIAEAVGKPNPIEQQEAQPEDLEQFAARLELIDRGITTEGRFLGKLMDPATYLAFKKGDWEPSDGLNQLMEEIESGQLVVFNAPTPEQQEQTHQAIKEMVEGGASEAEVQQFINGQHGFNQTGLTKYAESCRKELERRADIGDAIEDLLLRGKSPEIKLADYVPADWLPMFRVLKEGLRFPDEALVMAITATVAGMLPPKVKVKGLSMEEQVILWVFFIGTSGTAKSVLLNTLTLQPLTSGVQKLVNARNQQVQDAYKQAYAIWASQQDKDQKKKTKKTPAPEKPGRPVNVIYTAPSSQGIRADLAEHGANAPGVLVRDELNGWLKDMADPIAGSSDVEFWLSAYDGAFSNEVFADSSKSRKVDTGKLGVMGGIQPRVFLEQLESGNANGFNSRPLFIHLPRLRRQLLREDESTRLLKLTLSDLYIAAFKPDGVMMPSDLAVAYAGAKGFTSPDERHNHARGYWLRPEAETLFLELYEQLEELSMQAGSEEVEALWAKGPGQVLRTAAALQFIRDQTGQEEPGLPWCVPASFDFALSEACQSVMGTSAEGAAERYCRIYCPGISARTLQLAANLVMAGKVTGVQMHERAANPMLAKADKLLDHARAKQGKSPAKGVRLAEIRKNAFDANSRPTLVELKQLATMLQSRGLVQLLEGGKSVRVIR